MYTPNGLWSHKFLLDLLLFLVGLDHANDDDDDDSDDWEDDDESDLPAVQPGEDRICHSNLATDTTLGTNTMVDIPSECTLCSGNIAKRFKIYITRKKLRFLNKEKSLTFISGYQQTSI